MKEITLVPNIIQSLKAVKHFVIQTPPAIHLHTVHEKKVASLRIRYLTDLSLQNIMAIVPHTSANAVNNFDEPYLN